MLAQCTLALRVYLLNMASLMSANSAVCVQKPRASVTRRADRTTPARKATVCRAFKQQKVALSTAALTTLSKSLPAMAIVDDRLNGDGTGLPLGINDGALGIVLATIPLAIFGLYFFAGQQDSEIISGGKDDDSGLSL